MSVIKTTEEIRSLFTDGDFWDGSDFDHWLEAHDAEVTAEAEARIIKLLDEYPLPHWSPTEYIEYTEGYITGFQDALALIQGEELLGIDPEDIALIKGQKDNETVVFLTKNDAEQLANAILEE